jgi:aspartate/methionine/tyrosine aminotransferase
MYTENTDFLHCLSNINMMHQVAMPMQAMLSDLLDDERWVDTFLNDSKKKLFDAYKLVTDSLTAMDIPFVKASGSIFVYANFSDLLMSCNAEISDRIKELNPGKASSNHSKKIANCDNNTSEGEEALCSLFCSEARVVLTPGEAQFDAQPGHFRICYAWVNRAELEIGLKNLKICVERLRNVNVRGTNNKSR